MIHFEMNTSSLEQGLITLYDRAFETSEKAIQKADVYAREKAMALAPVHVEGYDLGYAWFPGGTLESSFTVLFKSIGSYSISSTYRMSGEKNPVAGGVDYAFYQEEEYSGEHIKGHTPYLLPAIESTLDYTVTFIENDLYLK